MLLEASLGSKPSFCTTSSDYLSQIMDGLMRIFSVRPTCKQSYVFASLDSSTGFKLQFKFYKNQASTRGTLVHTNGQPVIIPETFRDCLLKKLQKTIHTSPRFFFCKQTDSLLFRCNFHLESQSSNSTTILKQQLKSLIVSFAQIHTILISFGIVKKLNMTYKNMLAKRMKLISRIIEILKIETQDKNQNVEAVSQSEVQQRRGSVFSYYSKIQEIQVKNFCNKGIFSSSIPSIKRGGYFEVKRKICKITIQNNNQSKDNVSILDLAVKTLRKDHEDVPFCKNKLQKQIKILNQITDPKHSITYFMKAPKGQNVSSHYLPEAENKLCMEYVEETLDDYICGDMNSLLISVDYIHQLIKAVRILQSSGITHRDLKPENVLVKITKDENLKSNRQIKIIDFGESSLSKDSFDENKLNRQNLLGSTMPYSPLECYITCEKGFNSKQIDLWSVGLIAYQIFFKKNPVFYSRCFAGDINRGWRVPYQFSIFPSLYRKDGIQILSMVFSMLCLNSVCISQEQRISLQKMDCMIKEVEMYLKEEDLM